MLWFEAFLLTVWLSLAAFLGLLRWGAAVRRRGGAWRGRRMGRSLTPSGSEKN